MNLENIVQTGDMIFVHGNSWISRTIQKVTFSQVNHVGIIYDSKQVFETDITWGKASLRDLAKYNKVAVVIVRPKDIWPKGIQYLCEHYDKTPYSWLDIITNLLLAPFKDEIRKKVVEVVGTKKYMICSELTARIMYEMTHLSYLRGYEGYTPQDLLTICLDHPEDFEVIVDQISPTRYQAE